MVRTAIETTGKNPLTIKTEEDFVTLLQWVMSKPPFVPRPILNVLARERIANNTLEERIFREITADSVEPRVTGLTVPALIVWGSEDRILHAESAKILNRLMPRSRDYLMFRASLQ